MSQDKLYKICIVSSTRADFGILKSLIFAIKNDKSLILKLVATGSHLSKKYGNTVDEITSLGLIPEKKIKIISSFKNQPSNSETMSVTISKFSLYFSENRPDILILLGDRFEILAVALAATLNKILIAHLHGGEVTEGAFDEGFRHSLTKLSHLHFVSNKVHKKRVIQLGEKVSSVFDVGGLGAESITKEKLLKKTEIEKSLGFKFFKKNLLVTYHPETLSVNKNQKELKKILNAIKSFPEINFIFTFPNIDSGSNYIIDLIKKECSRSSNKRLVKSMGQKKYFSCLKYIDGVLGNSSSGLLEVPSFKIGTINIGNRQKGRLTTSSVINCHSDTIQIINSINHLYTDNFQNKLKYVKNPYYKKNTTYNILSTIKKKLPTLSLQKKFYDL